MPAVIVDQPWPPDVPTDLRRPDGSAVLDPTTAKPLRVSHDQLIVWVSLTPRRLPSPAGFPVIPAVFDTGFNDSFLIREEQAQGWLTPTAVARLPRNRNALLLDGQQVRGRDSDLWLYPNVPGTRDPDLAGTPVRLLLPLGAWLIPPTVKVSKDKPLLGLLAVAHNGLTVRLDGLARRVWVDTP